MEEVKKSVVGLRGDIVLRQGGNGLKGGWTQTKLELRWWSAYRKLSKGDYGVNCIDIL